MNPLQQQILGLQKEHSKAVEDTPPPPPKPNRAQRRAAQQDRARRIRRGQRAFDRQTRELDFGPAPTRQERRRSQA